MPYGTYNERISRLVEEMIQLWEAMAIVQANDKRMLAAIRKMESMASQVEAQAKTNRHLKIFLERYIGSEVAGQLIEESEERDEGTDECRKALPEVGKRDKKRHKRIPGPDGDPLVEHIEGRPSKELGIQQPEGMAGHNGMPPTIGPVPGDRSEGNERPAKSRPGVRACLPPRRRGSGAGGKVS